MYLHNICWNTYVGVHNQKQYTYINVYILYIISLYIQTNHTIYKRTSHICYSIHIQNCMLYGAILNESYTWKKVITLILNSWRLIYEPFNIPSHYIHTTQVLFYWKIC